VRHDAALDMLTPEPARVVQSFIGALAARRPESAEQYLAPAAREPGSVERLAAVADGLRARHGGFRFESGETDRQGDAAEVRATLATSRDGRVEQRFRLVRDADTRLWKIVDFDLQG